jgi:hypothetical protein
MLSKDSFDNFVIKAEFRTGPTSTRASSARRAAPDRGRRRREARADPGGPGYELQIRDKNPGNYTGGRFLTGSIVDVVKAPHDAKILPNQWNTLEATVTGDHFVVVFNGKKVADGHDAKRLLDTSVSNWLTRGARDTPIEFRNIKIPSASIA